MKRQYTYDNALVETFTFDNGSGTKEAHMIVHVTNATLSFTMQMNALTEAFGDVMQNGMSGFLPVFKRYFLSDAATQADQVYLTETERDCCALSIIEQPPLDGTKVALWCYMMTGVTTRALENGLYAVDQGPYRHLWGGSAHNLASNSEYQTRLLFNEYIVQLAKEDCTLKDNCIRTWFFVNDIDLNYGGVVRARNQVFFAQGLTNDPHFIASTGIGGRQAYPNVLTQMDSYAVAGIRPGQIRHLYAPTHLNRTSDYGVSFERGTCVDYDDRRHVFISGTASIDNKGQVVKPGDIVGQTLRMVENVEALLEEAECRFDDIGQIIVYLRDMADYTLVSEMMKSHFDDIPLLIVHAPVCRPGWLIEMECMGVREKKY